MVQIFLEKAKNTWNKAKKSSKKVEFYSPLSGGLEGLVRFPNTLISRKTAISAPIRSTWISLAVFSLSHLTTSNLTVPVKVNIFVFDNK